MRLAVLLAALALVVVAIAMAATPASRAPDPSALPTPGPAAVRASDDPATSPGAGSPYTFDDEFGGATLDPAWQRHFTCCGVLAGIDPGLATVGGGLLSLGVQQRPDGWYGSLIDTRASFTQRYGVFEARLEVPRGDGLWPAFWGYFSGNGTQAEIDTMELCGGEGGASGSILHNSVYWSQRQQQSHPTRTVDLGAAFHTYAVDWRPDRIVFSLDGQPVWTFSDVAHIPAVALPIILDLGVGGSFCGAPDASTPTTARLLVDWVHVRP